VDAIICLITGSAKQKWLKIKLEWTVGRWGKKKETEVVFLHVIVLRFHESCLSNKAFARLAATS